MANRRKMSLTSNASIGVITYTFIFIGVIAFLYLVLSTVIEPFQAQIYTDIARGMPVSGGRIDCTNTLVQGWIVFPVIAIIALFIWAIKQSLDDKDTSL